jgi:SOS-response transcriptional repressor LexA
VSAQKKEEKPWIKPIKDVREHYGWSQEEMAENLAVGQGAVSRWESGLREPSRQTYEELYMLAYDLPAAKFFWDRSRLSESRIEYMLKGLRYRLDHPLPSLKTEVLAAPGTVEFVNSWARLKSTPPPVAVPLLKDAIAAGEPRVVAETVDDVLYFSSNLIPHPEMTRCVKVQGDSMSPILEDDYVIVVDTFERASRELVNSMVVAVSPEGAVTVKWLRKIGREYVLVPQHTSPRHNPIILRQVPGWSIIGKVLFWIGTPPSK